MFSSAGLLLALLSTSIGIAGAVWGVLSVGAGPRRIVPFSGGLLMGIAVFGVLPELAGEYGWTGGIAGMGAGVLLLWVVGRYVYPVCPSCSQTHDHEHCATALHGFALPLVIATGIHAFLDGLGIAAAQQEDAHGLAVTVVTGVILHKVPEGVALGIMLRAAVGSRLSALGWACVAEGTTFFGALFESVITGRLGLDWVSFALAIAGGSFLYLGFHAVHGEWRRCGIPVFMPALTGAAGAAAIQQTLRVFFH